ncbi:hypothetical protein [Streptomyces bluensis]|uniref:hypothetical protein n=1 Tax=Streptomyces bluensis TaxID=33897 RepID=UPI00167389A3|nr:hypothetical protein [Streptomyces bluensis]
MVLHFWGAPCGRAGRLGRLGPACGLTAGPVRTATAQPQAAPESYDVPPTGSA